MSVTAIGFSLLTLAIICSLVAVATRWRVIKVWWYKRVHPSSVPDLREVFERVLVRINAIHDRRQLFSAILRTVADLVEAQTGSLLVRNGGQRFMLKESLGLKPISFQVGDITPFLDWLSRRGRSVTRRDLLERPDCADAKTSGLQYCVQFLAEACVPCFLGGELLAVINLGPTNRRGGFDDGILDMLDLLAGQFALAIHNANLYENVAKHNMQLEELARLKSQLLANVSHEFRTPLTSIIGWSDLLLDSATLSDEKRTHCSMIRDAGRRLLGTVSTLVDLSKLEANRLALDVRRLNLKKLVEEAGTDIQPGPNTTVRIGLGEDAPNIYGDQEWLRRVFTHLISNAVKYTPHGEVWIDAERAGEMLKVGVHDTGIGIEREKQGAIFFPFIQANGGPDRPYEGSGLGLVISRKVVELHGGRMWVTSQPGKGSHFFFTLPLKPTTIRAVEVRNSSGRIH